MDGSPPSPNPNHSERQNGKSPRRKRRSNWWYLLVLLPLIGLLYPPFYSRLYPSLGGVPFFVWYQFAWVLGGVAVAVAMNWLTD